MVLVDWDTCLLAPPERDVWLVAGEEPGILGTYEERTGSTLDARLLEAYRLRWDLADVASFAADLRAPHDDDEDTRTARAGLRAEVFDLMTKWIERYQRRAEERYQRLDALLAELDEHGDPRPDRDQTHDHDHDHGEGHAS